MKIPNKNVCSRTTSAATPQTKKDPKSPEFKSKKRARKMLEKMPKNKPKKIHQSKSSGWYTIQKKVEYRFYIKIPIKNVQPKKRSY